MRNFFAPITFSALLFVMVCLSALTNSPSQNLQPSPAPSPSLTLSPSATQTPSAKPTPSPVPTALNFHQWGSITLFNGLPSDSIRAIAQTEDGVMWFGTDNGLARFDGRRIQNFSLGELDANRVIALKTTSSGQLWIGTQKGVFVYS